MIKISSPNFLDRGEIPRKYTCDGENINPNIVIENIPEKTKSLALIMDDPDAPSGTFNHWLMWNINPATNEIGENTIPKNAVIGLNSGNKNKYMGPCPPSGTHRYFFKIFALDIELQVPETYSKKEIEEIIKDHIIDKAELIGLYTRE